MEYLYTLSSNPVITIPFCDRTTIDEEGRPHGRPSFKSIETFASNSLLLLAWVVYRINIGQVQPSKLVYFKQTNRYYLAFLDNIAGRIDAGP